MSNDKWINNVARLIKKKDGGYFLKFGRATKKDGTAIGENPFPLTIQEGDIFQAKLKMADLQKALTDGKLDQAQANKICQTVKFEFSIAPKDGSKKTETKKADDDEVNF